MSNALKRKNGPSSQNERLMLRLTPLGAGQEVGRSCILLELENKRVLLDCGLHPVHTGLSALPFLDEVDPSTIDVLLITHFHVDHAGALPYILEKTNFRGRVFMTHPTKAIYKWLLADYVKMCNISLRDKLYDEQDLMRSYNKVEVIDYYQEVEVEGIKFTPYYAGHVLGAAMFLIEIAGVKILYTGDYSKEEDRHLMVAECPPNASPDVLICESTYGVQSHEPRLDRELRFTKTVHEIINRGGRCLLPVFALGRAQEFLLILEEYWHKHPELQEVPIYYASSLAKKCMSVYQTYTNMMNARIRKSKTSNPFQFKYISNLKTISNFDDVGPCVMLASPGMLQNGASRELLELWCTNKNNGVIILGYVVEGTLGKHILSRPEFIPTMAGDNTPLRMSVDSISFSAHVDYPENYSFIEEVSAPSLVLVHGESNEMMRLRSALRSRYSDNNTPLKIYTPKNCETVRLHFNREKILKVLGKLAENVPTVGERVSGIMVGKDFSYRLTSPEDLPGFADLRPAEISQKQYIRCYAPAKLVFWHLKRMFGQIEYMGKRKACVFGCILIEQMENGRLWVLSWQGHPIKDTISDSIIGVILMCQTSPASVRETKSPACHSHESENGVEESEEICSESDIPSDYSEIGLSVMGELKDSGNDACLVSLNETDPKTKIKSFLKALSDISLFLKHQFSEDNVCLVRAFWNDVLVYKKGGDSEEIDDNESEETKKHSAVRLEGEIAQWRIILTSQKYYAFITSTKIKVEGESDELKRRIIAVLARAWKVSFPLCETWIYK